MNLRWSFAYALGVDIDAALRSFRVPKVRFYADSGDHTCKHLGLRVNRDTYAAWLEAWQHRLTTYSNFDVSWSPERSYANLRMLEDRGLTPTPTFALGESLHWLDRYLTEGYTYLILRGMQGQSWTRVHGWLDRVFAITGDRAVFHAADVESWRVLQAYPWASADTHLWQPPNGGGQVALFDRGRWVRVDLSRRADVFANQHLLRQYAIPGVRANPAVLSATAWRRAESWLRDIHGPVPLPPGRGYPTDQPTDVLRGPRMSRAADTVAFTLYLADNSVGHHAAHAAAAQRSPSWQAPSRTVRSA